DPEALTSAPDQLHRAGWSIGSTACATEAGGPVGVVRGHHGEDAPRAEGATECEAWRAAPRAAPAPGPPPGRRGPRPPGRGGGAGAMSAELTRGVLSRSVSGHVRDRAARFAGAEAVEAIRADPLRGFGPLDPAVLADPEAVEAIREEGMPLAVGILVLRERVGREGQVHHQHLKVGPRAERVEAGV